MIYQHHHTQLYYEIHGQGRPLVLIHGYYPDQRLMKGCYEPLFARRTGWQRIYMDLPGMGQTPASGDVANSDDLLDLLLSFIDHIAAGQSFAVAGESYGGYLARGLARRAPERVDGLMLLCPCIEPAHAKRELPAYQVIERDEALLASLTPQQREDFEPMAVIQTPEVWQRYLNEIFSGVSIAQSAYLEELRATGYAFREDVDALSRPFLRPTLFLLGRQDTSVGYRDAWRILENYPRASFAVIDAAGHNLQIEQPAVFETLTHAWLDRVEREVPVK